MVPSPQQLPGGGVHLAQEPLLVGQDVVPDNSRYDNSLVMYRYYLFPPLPAVAVQAVLQHQHPLRGGAAEQLQDVQVPPQPSVHIWAQRRYWDVPLQQ